MPQPSERSVYYGKWICYIRRGSDIAYIRRFTEKRILTELLEDNGVEDVFGPLSAKDKKEAIEKFRKLADFGEVFKANKV